MTMKTLIGAAAFACALPAYALPTLALAAEVNVYTSREPELIKPVLDAFTKSTGIKVNSVFIRDGLEERVAAEGANSPADVIVLVDVARLVRAKEMGIIQPVRSDALNAAIPESLRDPDGQWFATTLRSRVVYASKDRIAQNAITYEDLADPKWKGRVCIRSGQHPYNQSLISAYIAKHGSDKAEAWLRGLKANLAKRPSGGDRDVAKDILAGSCDIGVGNTYYVGLLRHDADPRQKEWGEAVKILDSRFADGGTHVNISGAAVTKNAPDQAEAIRLIEFMVSEEAQNILANLNFEYPVRPGIAANATTELFGPIHADPTPLTAIAAQRKAASELVDKVGFDR
jgi:iron(III) transport system substrate-binding protein